MAPTLELLPLADGVGIRLIGEVDIATAPQLREALQGFRTSDVALDLSELTFMALSARLVKSCCGVWMASSWAPCART